MILAALLVMQSVPPPPSIDFDRLLAAPPLIRDANSMICATWNERNRENPTARIADMAWLQGFVDGARAESGDSANVYFPLILGSMDSDCERNPDALVMDTAKAVLTRLRNERH